MAGTSEGAQKRLVTQKIQAIVSGTSTNEMYSEWGRKGSKVTTGGFQNMSPEKLKEASRKGVKVREEKRGQTKD